MIVRGKIAVILAVAVFAVIAIASVWIWTAGSPRPGTLIAVSMGAVFLAVFIVLVITATRRRASEEEEVERVIEILKRAKRIKDEIERRGGERT